MALVQRTINQCDVCGHEWIPRSAGERCGNRDCRSTKWNDSVDNKSIPEPTFDTLQAKPSIESLRAICAGDLPDTPGLVTTQPCTYTEYDYESGETYRCGLHQHSSKVKHTRGIKL